MQGRDSGRWQSTEVIISPFHRRRRRHASSQNEIQPASSSGGFVGGTTSASSSFSQPATTIPDIIEQLRSPQKETLHQALTQIISITKQPNEGVITEFVTNGALPALIQILTRNDFDVQIRIRVAAAVCNLSQARHSLRSFGSCDAVPLLVDYVIGDHQALTGAAALMFKSMLISENLVRLMIETHAPTVLLRGLMLCTNLEICDTIIDVLIQMTTVDVIKDRMIENRAVETCVYYLRMLATSHYLTSVRQSEQYQVNQEGCGQLSFTQKSMKDALVWSLMQPDGIRSQQRHMERFPPLEAMGQRTRQSTKDWETLLRNSPVIGSDERGAEFTEVESKRAALFVELLTNLVGGSPLACNRFASVQLSLDVLAYWIRQGPCQIKQGGLLTTCYLLRNGHRGFLTLKHVIDAIVDVLRETESNGSGVMFCNYKCVAAEVVNDLCAFGGDNVCLTIQHAGILEKLMTTLEIDDYELQRYTLRAIHRVCEHPLALATLVDCGAITFLCRFLSTGLKDVQSGQNRTRPAQRESRGCLSRKRVETFSMTQAEIDSSRRQEQEYSRIRRLEYCTALLRCIAAVQSPEWLHSFNKNRIVPIALDALVQNYSPVMRRQALGILASIVTVRDTNALTTICLERGCEWLLNLRTLTERSGADDASKWKAWINFVLYYIFQSPKTRVHMDRALRQEYGDSADLSDKRVHELLKPDQRHLDVEWITRIS